MPRDVRTVNLAPGDVELAWDDDEPVLEFREYRDGVIHKVRVRVGRYVGRAIAASLHHAQKKLEERASELLRALRGA